MYLEYAAMKLNSLCHAIVSASWSIHGGGKLSLGHALLRFMKSMHIGTLASLVGRFSIVAHDLEVNPYHVYMCPCKHILVMV